MTHIVSFLRGSTLRLIVGLVFSNSLIFSHATFAQAVTPKSTVTLSKNSKLVQSQAGFYRMTVGDVNVTALSDGTVGLQILDGLLLNAKSGEVQKLLTYNYQKSPIDSSLNAFLIQRDGKLTLIDAGSAELVGPTANKLPDSLRAVGVQPEQITDIFLTHIHPDHSGGLMEGNKRVFPHAIIHVDKRELDYWFDKSIAEKPAKPLKTFFSQAVVKVKPYVDSAQLKTFEGATQFSPGFRSQPAYGHTRTFADAAENGYLLAFDHLSFPGVGHIRKEGDHYRWIPVEYMNDALKPQPHQSQGETIK
jgi:glyoxylase-like metal-dependent hydrolase (beta-lactamase superfamily II)